MVISDSEMGGGFETTWGYFQYPYEKDGKRAYFHRPHPQKEALRYRVADAISFKRLLIPHKITNPTKRLYITVTSTLAGFDTPISSSDIILPA